MTGILPTLQEDTWKVLALSQDASFLLTHVFRLLLQEFQVNLHIFLL
jgi:hypothetical protein